MVMKYAPFWLYIAEFSRIFFRFGCIIAGIPFLSVEDGVLADPCISIFPPVPYPFSRFHSPTASSSQRLFLGLEA